MGAAGIRVRRARPSDAVRIRNLHVRSIRVLCAGDYTRRQIAAWSGGCKARNYRRAMTQGERMFVAVVDGRVEGFSSARAAEVRTVYVDPRHARAGLGRRLLAAAERSAAAAGRGRVWLNATLTAVPFYVAQGYRRGRRHALRFRGVPIPCVRMTKRVCRRA